MEYKRSAHVEEEDELDEEEEESEEEEEGEEEEEMGGRQHHLHHHHFTTAPALAPTPATGAPQLQHQHMHGAAQVLASSHAAASPSSLADMAAFSRPLLPPNSSLVSSPPPGFLAPHPHPLQQHAHRRMLERERGRTVETPPPREPERHQHQHHQQQRQQEPARNGVLAGAGGAMHPQAPTLAVATGGAARAPGEQRGGSAGPAAEAPLPWRYRECLRNHAARMGAHVLDGCGEFMPSPGDASAALLCAACGCHRSFHRREPVLVASPTPSPASAVVSPSAAATPNSSRLMPLLLAPPHMQQKRPQVPPVSPMSAPVPASPKSAPAALAESSSEELRPPQPPPPPPPQYSQAAVGGSASAPPAPGKKRFRTKFTPEQKERMLDFAHRVGWRIHKPDGAVDAFCAQVGVPRRVLKVWMHNNKHLAKTPPTTPSHSQPLPPHQQHDPPHHHHHHHHHHHNQHPAQHNHHQQQQHDP